MTLNDFENEMIVCGRSVQDDWIEEDKYNVNPLNVNKSKKQYIGEEIKKNIGQAVVALNQSAIYQIYGPISSFRTSGFVLQIATTSIEMPFTSDITLKTNDALTYIELKKLKPQTFNRQLEHNIDTCPMLFAPTGTSTFDLLNLLKNKNFGSSAIFQSPSNGDLMTYFHEGQIWLDIARLINFRKNNEILFFGAYIFSPVSLGLTSKDMQERLDLILNEFTAVSNREVLSEGGSALHSWQVKLPININKANSSFTSGVKHCGQRGGYDIYAFAFEIK